MEIPKDQILQLLRDRGDHDNADQADQQLPDQVDPEQHSDLLAEVGMKPANWRATLAGSSDNEQHRI